MNGELPNVKKWVVLYPVYINSKKTIAEGRRICATKACENPTCDEIGDCCKALNLPSHKEVFTSIFGLIIILFYFIFLSSILVLISSNFVV